MGTVRRVVKECGGNQVEGANGREEEGISNTLNNKDFFLKLYKEILAKLFE